VLKQIGFDALEIAKFERDGAIAFVKNSS